MTNRDDLRRHLDEAIERAKAGIRLSLSGDPTPLTKAARTETSEQSVENADDAPGSPSRTHQGRTEIA
jgi:hypothetical protein